jgi:ATP-binding cassette subfamily B protein
LERIHEVLDAPIDRPEEITGARPFPTPAQGPELVFQDLTLQYGDRAVLNRFSARIPAGSMVGIFGKTGSGKTTLLRVIARLINPEPGMVKVAGVDIRDLDLMDWRKRVTLVTQVPFLFSESIAENVAFGKEIQVLPALRLARMESDLETLPEREKTVVGERGIVLSGGQRQRVALARGLARESELLLLDDVLSAVDHKTETELIANLEARAQGSSTILLVSHRMSVLEKCDVVLVMEEGKVVDSGTHLELIARPGLYLNAWLAASEEEAA